MTGLGSAIHEAGRETEEKKGAARLRKCASSFSFPMARLVVIPQQRIETGDDVDSERDFRTKAIRS